MGFWKKLGKVVNKVTDIGSGIVGYIPGVGPIASGVLDAAGDLAGGKNLKSALLSGLKTGGTAAIGGKLASALAKSGKLGSVVGGAAAKAAPRVIGIGPGGVPIIDQTGGITPGAVASAAGGGGGWLDKLGSVLGGGQQGGGTNWMSVLGNIAKVGLPALGAYQASKTQGQANEYRKKAIEAATADYAAAAPLRTMGLQGLTDPRLADVSSIFAPPSRNYRRLAV